MFKLGRLPRSYKSGVAHLSSILGAMDNVPIPPPSVDWTKGVKDYGMMLNDTLGDCTCAAVYHARQVWTLNNGGEKTQSDTAVLQLYKKACGYNPTDPSTDRGGNEQTVLTYLLKHGMPLGGGVDKIKAFFEVDPRNLDDIKTVINECGVCYIGFDVPKNIDETPGSIWQLDKAAPIEGGHAVALVGYDPDTVTLISWGSLYKMTWEFFQYYTDEAYAIIDGTWTPGGKNPLGLTDESLMSMMKSLQD